MPSGNSSPALASVVRLPSALILMIAPGAGKPGPSSRVEDAGRVDLHDQQPTGLVEGDAPDHGEATGVDRGRPAWGDAVHVDVPDVVAGARAADPAQLADVERPVRPDGQGGGDRLGHHRPTRRRLRDQGEYRQRGDLPRRVDEQHVVGGGIGDGETAVVGHHTVGIAVDGGITRTTGAGPVVRIVGRLIRAEARHRRGRPAAEGSADQVTE